MAFTTHSARVRDLRGKVTALLAGVDALAAGEAGIADLVSLRGVASSMSHSATEAADAFFELLGGNRGVDLSAAVDEVRRDDAERQLPTVNEMPALFTAAKESGREFWQVVRKALDAINALPGGVELVEDAGATDAWQYRLRIVPPQSAGIRAAIVAVPEEPGEHAAGADAIAAYRAALAACIGT